VRRPVLCVLWLGALASAPAAAAPAKTLALLPPASNAQDAELSLLIQARASSLLGATNQYTLFHVKQILRMAELESLSPGSFSDPTIAEQIRQHLGASRLAYGKLTAQGADGWDLELWAGSSKGAPHHATSHLPAAFAAAIETGARALAQGVAGLDGVKLPALPEQTIPDDAWRAYGRCYARVVRQPIGIENPTLLDEAELTIAVDSCRQALQLFPNWDSARAVLAIALAIRGADREAVATLAPLSPDAKAHAFYWVARFWLVTRYESNEAGAGVLGLAVEKAPRSLLLRGYLAEHLNAIGHHADALAAWQEYQKLAPDSAFVLARLGYTLARLGRYKEAIEKTQAAVDADPSSINLKLELASRLIDAALPERAIAVLSPLATPDARAEILLRLGYAHLMNNELDVAEGLIRRALDRAQKASEWRTRARAKYDLAKVEVRRNRPEKAKALILDALAAGYKPYSLAREDKDLMVIAKAAELEQQSKPPAHVSLLPQPKEASPFEIDGAGDIDTTRQRPPPPEGFAVIHFGS
jgi:tetratricopeptide (TPR) repeat protein